MLAQNDQLIIKLRVRDVLLQLHRQLVDELYALMPQCVGVLSQPALQRLQYTFEEYT